MIFKNWNTGERVAEKSIPNAEGKSISYGFEYIGSKEYFVVRDYYTNDILHKFTRTKKMQCSLEFFPEDSYDY